MNDKPFTLYYINLLKDISADNFPTNAGKISDVKRISKGMTVIGWKENNNHYAIFGDNSNIISMGKVKTMETKNKNIIYIGQKIYSNSQKELYDYIKQEITKRIQDIQKKIVRAQNTKKNLSNTLTISIYDKLISQMYGTIKIIQTNAKELITNLKKI